MTLPVKTNFKTDIAKTGTPEYSPTEPLPPSPVLQSVECIEEGWINKYILHYISPTGKPFDYESVSRKGPQAYEDQLRRLGRGEIPQSDAVGMVPILPDGSLLCIREFRYPMNSWSVSFPAGLIEEGETIREAVARELSEETGYLLREDLGEDALYVLPQTGFSSTGMTDESVQVVFAQVKPGGIPRPEDTEHIQPFILKRCEIRAFLDENRLPIATRCQLILEALAE